MESDVVRPRQARYQAALRPDMKCTFILKHLPTLLLILRDPALRPEIQRPNTDCRFEGGGVAKEAQQFSIELLCVGSGMQWGPIYGITLLLSSRLA
jgi:hypothetical protein